MTKIKLCGLSRPWDIEATNELAVDYIGFVFAPKSRRYVTPKQAAELSQLLAPGIQAVGVFVNEPPEAIAGLLNSGTIDLAQLHGDEGENYIGRLRALTNAPILQAFRISSLEDVGKAEHSSADHILLDSGMGTGTVFDWMLLRNLARPYFLAGGLGLHNITSALDTLHPYAVDISSGIETNGYKDRGKIADFVAAVRKKDPW